MKNTNENKTMSVKITSGAGRHGKGWNVRLIGAHGYTIYSFVADSQEAAKTAALRAFGDIAKDA